MDGGEPELGRKEASTTCKEVIERVETAAVIDRHILAALLATVVARGHVLLEDVPGTGKSVTARVLAEALGLEFRRIQFTPDLLPADITGSNIYNENDQEFEFSKGPIFTNVVLADEINRAPPKTQAALLEAMEERQVSVDGTTHKLPEPFLVIATQNPVEQEGTFRLPEAQRDRFSIKASMGYPDVEGEMGLLERRSNRRTLSPSVEAATEPETVTAMQELAEDVTVEKKVRRYIVELARATRSDSRTEMGISPRGVQRMFELSRAVAVLDGREYVVPDDVKRMAKLMMTHRLVLTTEATVEGVDPARVVDGALNYVDVPAVAPGEDEPAGASEPITAEDGAGEGESVEPATGPAEHRPGDGQRPREQAQDRQGPGPDPATQNPGQRGQQGRQNRQRRQQDQRPPQERRQGNQPPQDGQPPRGGAGQGGQPPRQQRGGQNRQGGEPPRESRDEQPQRGSGQPTENRPQRGDGQPRPRDSQPQQSDGHSGGGRPSGRDQSPGSPTDETLEESLDETDPEELWETDEEQEERRRSEDS